MSGTFIGGGAGTAAVIDFDRMPGATGAAGLNLEADDDGAFGAGLSAALPAILFWMLSFSLLMARFTFGVALSL